MNRRKHIVIDIAVWFAILGVGAAVLLASRHYGNRYLARDEAESLFVEASDLLNQGAVRQAQQTALRAYNTAPAWVAEQAHVQFGPRLLLMPELVDRLRAHFERGPGAEGESGDAESVRLALLLERNTDPAALDARFAQAASQQPEAILARANLAVDRGDFGQARTYFDAYWRYSGKNKAGTREALARDFRNPRDAAAAQVSIDVAYRLFRAGMWTEAAAVAAKAAEHLPGDPGVLFFNALRLDLDNHPAEARTAYEALLAAAPTHRLGLQRLRQLSTR